MTDKNKPDLTADDVYVMFWRLVQMAVHRYGSHPTGELLIVLTILLLDRAGYNPTVTELADIANLPKSSVSRYVSTEMANGFLEEVIDSRDRRRRLLQPSAKAREELDWHRVQVRDMAHRARPTGKLDGHPGEQLKAIMQELAKSG